jgi:hypothetical protein
MERNQTRKGRANKRREDRLPRVKVTCRQCGKQYEAAQGSKRALARQCDDDWAAELIASVKRL